MKKLIGLVLLVASVTEASAANILGSASDFAVLAGTTITNSGNTVVDGHIGVAPGTAITGFPPGLVSGAIHSNDATASLGEVDLTSAYLFLSGANPDLDLTGSNMGGLTLVAGVYHFDSSADLTGTLTLSGSGIFIFQMGTAFNAANGSSIVTMAGADPRNIYFVAGSSTTAGTGAALQGNIVALQSISLGTGTSLNGRALAINGAVTLLNNAIMNPTPEPGTLALFALGMSAILLRRRVTNA